MVGEVSIEPVFTNKDGIWNLSVIANAKELKESLGAAVRSDYEVLVAGEPVIRSDFDIYINDNTLTYAKESCDRVDTEAIFLLHLIPADVADLPDDRKQHGFENLDFDFNDNGMLVDGNCWTEVNLPGYDIAAIRTGQYVPVDGGFEHLWEGKVLFDAAE